MIGASAALSISDIPFGGPTAAVNVGYSRWKNNYKSNCSRKRKSRFNINSCRNIREN